MRSARLSRSERFVVYAISAGVWLTGIAWLLWHYLPTPDGEFGPQPHPLEPWTLTIHAAFAFATIGLLGWMWARHMTPGWRTTRRRRSGGSLAGVAGLLVVSGYLLYYVGNETLRPWLSFAHWSVGAAVPLAFVLHRFGVGSTRGRRPFVAQEVGDGRDSASYTESHRSQAR